MLKRVVTAVEILAVLSFVVFVALLLFDQPESTKAALPAGKVDGAAIFDSQCAYCHGAKGQGSGGPQLNGGAVTRDFPDAGAELVVVQKGRSGMPAFENRLTPEQLQAVVDFTRSGLQQR